jgi:hypothetical protein
VITEVTMAATSAKPLSVSFSIHPAKTCRRAQSFGCSVDFIDGQCLNLSSSFESEISVALKDLGAVKHLAAYDCISGGD